jgi:CDP-diacylglycerol--serine O-phosphatidyltransferase
MRRDLVAPLFVFGVLIVAFLASFPFLTMSVLTLAYLGSLPLSWRSYQQQAMNGGPQAAASATSEVRVR